MALFGRKPDQRRARLVAGAPPGPLADHLSVPLPNPRTAVADLKLLAVDLETTGLDPTTGRILSVGFVAVDGGAIILGTAREIVVEQGGMEVGQSAALHGLTDDQLARGVPLREALVALLAALQGRCLLAHHAAVEEGFLSRAVRQELGGDVVFSTVDTMSLQYRLLSQGFDDEPGPGQLRLAAARDQFGLPRYRAHEALTDALACAELYLAQVQALGLTDLRSLQA